jgi:hypothetical protein
LRHFQYFPIKFSNNEEEEDSLQLNYRLMAEASNISQIIKDQTAAIEKNMKFGPTVESPQKKMIDMSLIE